MKNKYEAKVMISYIFRRMQQKEKQYIYIL